MHTKVCRFIPPNTCILYLESIWILKFTQVCCYFI